MNPRDRLERLFEKRLSALVKDLPSARDGDAGALHRTRVASRRVREALPLLDGAMKAGRLSKAQASTRRLTRALGRVRELDVALALLGTLEPTRPSQRIAIEAVREHLARQRDAMRAEMRDRLTDLRPDKVVRKIAGTLEAREAPRGAAWRSALRARIKRRAFRLLQAMDEAGAIYLPDRLHAVRIAVKKLRYALELAAETGSGSTSRVRTLKAAQDALGDLHDQQVLIGYIQQVQAALPPAKARELEDLDLLVRRVDDRCRERHATYIASRAALRRIAAAYTASRPSTAPPRRASTTHRTTTAADRLRRGPSRRS
jgi:CHAD domain-containing protein